MASRQRVAPVQPRARAMRRSLLDVTTALLATGGSPAVTTTAVARRAHVSTGTVYRYFEDREALLTELRDEAVAAITDDLMVAVVTALEEPAEAALRRVVVALVAAFERHAPILAAVVDAAPAGVNADLLPQVEDRLRQLASLLPRRHRPDLPPSRLEAVVFMLMGVLVSTCLRVALQRPADLDREELVDITTAMLLATLGAPS